MNNRIIIISLNDKVGGAEQVLKIIANYYINIGYSIDVFFLTKSKGSLWKNMKGDISYYYSNNEKEKYGLFCLVTNLVKNRNVQYDLGFTSHIYTNSLLGILKKSGILKIKKLIGRDSHSYFLVESGFKKLLYSFLISIGYPGLDLLISQTDEMKNQMILNKPNLFKRIPIEKIPNPVNFEFIENKIIPNVYLNKRFIVSAGRLIKIKGFDILINAFNKIQDVNCLLLILGDGEEKDNLQDLIGELGLQDRVVLLGFIDNVYPYFKYAETCVISSIKEGFPNVLLQMMSQNTNIVTTLCAGGIDQIEGLIIVNPNDVEELALGLKQSLKEKLLCNDTNFNKELESRSITKFINAVELILND